MLKLISMIVAGVFLTVALVGCHHQNSIGAKVGGHQVTVKRHLLPLGDTQYKDDRYFKYADRSPHGTFEFVIEGDKITVNGHEMGSLKARDEVRVTDGGVSVWSAEQGKWMDHGQSERYLAENAKQITAAN